MPQREAPILLTFVAVAGPQGLEPACGEGRREVEGWASTPRGAQPRRALRSPFRSSFFSRSSSRMQAAHSSSPIQASAQRVRRSAGRWEGVSAHRGVPERRPAALPSPLLTFVHGTGPQRAPAAVIRAPELRGQGHVIHRPARDPRVLCARCPYRPACTAPTPRPPAAAAPAAPGGRIPARARVCWLRGGGDTALGTRGRLPWR